MQKLFEHLNLKMDLHHGKILIESLVENQVMEPAVGVMIILGTQDSTLAHISMFGEGGGGYYHFWY